MDHVESFKLHSSHRYVNVNTEYGFPDFLSKYTFDVIILHYSLFGSYPFSICSKFINYIKSCSKTVKVAFFQDEYQYCINRYKFIDKLEISVIFSLVERDYLDRVYLDCESVKHVFHTLTGYVSNDLLSKCSLFAKPFNERTVDFGYRARSLPYVMGKGAQEKTQIALEFSKLCQNKDYTLDFSVTNKSRIYGDDWYRFVANCKAMLGVEAGVSLFDIDGTAEIACSEFLKDYPDATFQQTYDTILNRFENSETNVYYRQISPRIFEAAAFKVCLILFEGNYSGLLKPHVHYIPLQRNFGNLDFVLSEINSSKRRDQLVQNAYHDLIASELYSYKRFVSEVDQNFSDIGINSIHSEFNFDKLSDKLRFREIKLHYILKAKHKLRRMRYMVKSLAK